MKVYVGIDIGGTNTKIGIIDENGILLSSNNIKTNSHNGVSNTVENISEEIVSLLISKNLTKSDIISIGIGVPGPVVNHSTVKFFANFPWEHNLDIAKEFQKHFDVSVFADNDVNVITMGEAWVGGAKGYTDILGVAIGTGIGGGIIINGKPVSGKHGAAGEIGHIKLQTNNARQCGCKQYGCFEAYASAKSICDIAISDIDNHKDSKLYNIYQSKQEIEAKDIFDSAKLDDTYSKELVDRQLDDIAYGISTALNLLDPQIVIIGGGISLAGDYVFEKIYDNLKKYTLPIVLENLKITNARLGNEAGIYGAAYLAMIYTKGE